jgi:ABC-2 type transport system permease protein
MQYRASFILQSIGAFLITGFEFIAVWMLFDRFGQLRGWSLAEVALLYGVISVTFAIADAIGRGFDQFAVMVKAGDFDRLLLRPRSTVLQLLGQELTLRRVGRFLQGLVILIYAIVVLQVDWDLARMLLLIMSIACGICLFLGLLVMQATSAFWTTESLEVWNAFTYGGVFMSQYPLTIYRAWFARFFTFVIPLACINYLPMTAILRRNTSAWCWLAPLAGLWFLLFSLQLWKFGVRHYRSTGS